MKEYNSDQLRNVAIIAHGGAGKTSLAESLLFTSGTINRLGKVEDGSTCTDYEPEEIKRKVTISTALAPFEWKNYKFNILDTPGYLDFTAEVKSSLRAVEAALVVVCASSGVEVGTKKVWSYAADMQLPRIILINKMDRENANFGSTLEELKSQIDSAVVAIQIPIGEQDCFSGVIDLLTMKALYPGNGPTAEYIIRDIPDDYKMQAEQYRQNLIDAIAETDDELLNKYLEGETLTSDELEQSLYQAVHQHRLYPVYCGSAIKTIGIAPLIDSLVKCVPSPLEHPVEAMTIKQDDMVECMPDSTAPLAALVFKTTTDPYVGRLNYVRVFSGTLKSDSMIYNSSKDKSERIGQIVCMRGKNQSNFAKAVAGDIIVLAKLQDTHTGDTLCSKEKPLIFDGIAFPQPMYRLSVEAKNKQDEDKIGGALVRLMDEDPTFQIFKDPSTGQTLMAGMGDLHLDIITDRLKRKFGVEVKTSLPRVPYRETIRSSVKVEGKHKKQSGGHGQYGHVWLRMEPLSTQDFEFGEELFGGSVPKQYVPAVEKGVREALQTGILAGYPMVNLKVTLYDGSYHSVDSSEMAFKIASQLAFRKGALQAKPVLLEPVCNVEVHIPEEYMGDIVGDMNSKRGKILGMEPVDKGMGIVKAVVPMAEMFRYTIDLKSLTQGCGDFTMEFSHYEEIPPKLAESIILAYKQDKAEGE